MNAKKPSQQGQTAPKSPQASLRVRTDLRAGAWNCRDCVGTVSGSQMSRPTCELCQPA